MKLAGAKKQTIFLTGINGVVRALGLTMRILISRILGAEIMGIMELAQSVHMIAIAPLTSGIPVAVSRLTARSEQKEQVICLASGLQLVRRVSFVLIPFFWLLSPVISHWMGEPRVLPSLWFTAPCILILGYSACYNGYCYGIERSEIPAISELIEQIVRFGLTLFLLGVLSNLTVSWVAAVPVAATMVAEIAGLIWVVFILPKRSQPSVSASWTKAILKLSIPATANRLLQTFLRSITAILIPLRLQVGGLSAVEATAQLGRLNGMVMPLLMLPSIFTSALSMVTIPRFAKAEEQPSELRRLLLISLFSSLLFAGICTVLVYFSAPFLGAFVYRQAELIPLFRASVFQILLFPINHLLSSVLSALGQQRRSLTVSGISAAFSLVATWLLAGRSGINGVIFAQYTSQTLSILLGGIALLQWKRERLIKSGDRSA